MLNPEVKTFRVDLAVVTLQGHFVLGKMSELRSVVRELICTGCQCIVIDLALVDKIDCAGIGELVRYYTQAGDAGILLALRAPSRRIRDLLAITKLINVFPIIKSKILSNGTSTAND